MVTAKDTKIQQELGLKNSLQIISQISRKVLSSVCQCLDPGQKTTQGRKVCFRCSYRRLQSSTTELVQQRSKQRKHAAEAPSRFPRKQKDQIELEVGLISKGPPLLICFYQLLENALEPSKQHNLRAQHSKHELVEDTSGSILNTMPRELYKPQNSVSSTSQK